MSLFRGIKDMLITLFKPRAITDAYELPAAEPIQSTAPELAAMDERLSEIERQNRKRLRELDAELAPWVRPRVHPIS